MKWKKPTLGRFYMKENDEEQRVLNKLGLLN
jgi:hypothetical protein